MGILDSQCDICGSRDGYYRLVVWGDVFRCEPCAKVPTPTEQDGPGCDEYETMAAQKYLHGGGR